MRRDESTGRGGCPRGEHKRGCCQGGRERGRERVGTPRRAVRGGAGPRGGTGPRGTAQFRLGSGGEAAPGYRCSGRAEKRGRKRSTKCCVPIDRRNLFSFADRETRPREPAVGAEVRRATVLPIQPIHSPSSGTPASLRR